LICCVPRLTTLIFKYDFFIIMQEENKRAEAWISKLSSVPCHFSNDLFSDLPEHNKSIKISGDRHTFKI